MNDDIRAPTTIDKQDKGTRRQGDKGIPNLPVCWSPGLLISPPVVGPSCEPDAYGHCSTCADEARQARVLRVDAAAGLALVDTGGATGEVDISLVDELAPDDVVLIHGGVAIAKL